MKHFYYFILTSTILIHNCAKAQNSQISIDISPSNFNKIDHSNDKGYYKMREFSLNPSISYFQSLNKNWGIGIEIGRTYLNSSYENWILDNDSFVPYDNNKVEFKNYFIGIGAFKEYNYKKYSINILSLIRFEHIFKQIETNISFKNVIYDNTIITRQTNPQTYKIGLYLRPNLYREITPNIDIGIGINLGVYTEFFSGTYITFWESISDNSYDSESLTIKMKNNYHFYFDKIGCQFSLKYNFNWIKN